MCDVRSVLQCCYPATFPLRHDDRLCAALATSADATPAQKSVRLRFCLDLRPGPAGCDSACTIPPRAYIVWAAGALVVGGAECVGGAPLAGAAGLPLPWLPCPFWYSISAASCRHREPNHIQDAGRRVRREQNMAGRPQHRAMYVTCCAELLKGRLC